MNIRFREYIKLFPENICKFKMIISKSGKIGEVIDIDRLSGKLRILWIRGSNGISIDGGKKGWISYRGVKMIEY